MTQSAALDHPSTSTSPPGPRPTRLVSARPGIRLIERPRLNALLDAAVSGRLTLLSAPPGSGKTTTLVAWAERRADSAAIAWLTLDELQNNPRSFWYEVAAAAARATGSPAPEATSTEAALVASLFASLGGERPLVLVLDDFHEIRDPLVLTPFARFLTVAPDPLRVVIGTRRDPDLDLHLLRLHGDLVEIRARELAFTRSEAGALFATEGLDLSEEQIGILVDRTEGWAAGLRFAALSVHDRPDVEPFIHAFDRTERTVADYLVHEVLSVQEPALRDFLLRTSLCERICGPLANVITGRTDGERILAGLERGNVFIERERDDAWFRYHGLFLELLRAEAACDLGDAVQDVHCQAASWLALNGHGLQALRHAIAGGDAALAAALVDALWIDIVSEGYVDAAGTLLHELDQDSIRTHAPLARLAAWHRLCIGEIAEADGWTAVAERSSTSPAGGDRHSLGRDVVALARARLAGDPAAIEEAAAALARPEALVVSSRSNERLRALTLCALGAASVWRGDLGRAAETLEEALGLSRRAAATACEADAASLLAFVYAARGQLKRAARLAQVATASSDRRRGCAAPPGQLVPAQAALAICAFEWGDVEGGESRLQAARSAADASGDASARLLALAVYAWSVGRVGTALDEDIRLRLAATRGATAPPPLLVLPLQILRSRLALAEGDLDAAAATLGGSEASSGDLEVALARVELARGHLESATELLDAVLGGGRTLLFARAELEAAILRSLVAMRKGDADRAYRFIERALELAEPDGVRGPFLDAAPGVAEPLGIAVRRGTAHRWLAAALLAAVEGRTKDVAAVPHELLEPLSERERVVLRYLPTLMSNPEIASELFVSVNTVKTHLKSIYRKLGVSQRREAVRRARELRLIA